MSGRKGAYYSQIRELKAYQGNEPFVFVSYSHRDSDRVLPVISRMMAEGFRVWYDSGIDPGTEWDENIARHIDECGYFVAFLSENYLSSNNCKDELNYARDLEKERLIVYLEQVELPSGMAMRINRLQSVFKYAYESEEDFYQKLFTTNNIEKCHNSSNASGVQGSVDYVSQSPGRIPVSAPENIPQPISPVHQSTHEKSKLKEVCERVSNDPKLKKRYYALGVSLFVLGIVVSLFAVPLNNRSLLETSSIILGIVFEFCSYGIFRCIKEEKNRLTYIALITIVVMFVSLIVSLLIWA